MSIVTPCLNSVSTIRQTIESVLSQTYSNIEYIIVDGSSNDGTLDIIKEYYPRFHGRMKYISKKDKGIYDAMNKGIRLSTGSLIGIINSDDYYEKDAVEKAIRYRTDDKYQVVYGYCRVIERNTIKDILKNNHENLDCEMIPHPTCFVTRSVYRDLGMFLTGFKIAGDYELMIRIYESKKVRFTQIKQIIANFRTGGACCDIKHARRENILIAYYYKKITFGNMIVSLLNSI